MKYSIYFFYYSVLHSVLTDVECEVSYRIALMEALQTMESNSNYVMTKMKKSQVGYNELFAILSLAFEVPSSEICIYKFKFEKEKLSRLKGKER